MRIITGKFKKTNLFSVSGNTTRPTTDFIKEAIFSTIFNCENLLVLDLYAGSGSLGLEAISRGAKFVDFIEFSEKAIQAIIKNIQKLKCEEQSHIYRKKVSSFLKKTDKKYDLIFMDPPYDKNLVNKTIELILENSLLNESGKIVVEHSPQEIIVDLIDEMTFFQKKYSDTIITIIEKDSER
ncbi:MAG: 16S rRNA (guanine(966)-N(2))-methyltransferase RsmD [Candidatus Cloacimonetes bacterium]|nr:16S rRNA (guanine(966)-N(2))-methyltransferase RsmD [Candidatus Cloacimonadota bacterium]